MSCGVLFFFGVGDLPAVGEDISGDLPSTSVDASGSLPSGEVNVSVPSVSGAVGGVEGAVGDLSADMPSVDVKKPKKSRFGGMPGFKMPSVKGKAEVSGSRVALDLFWLLRSHFGRDWLVVAHGGLVCCFRCLLLFLP